MVNWLIGIFGEGGEACVRVLLLVSAHPNANESAHTHRHIHTHKNTPLSPPPHQPNYLPPLQILRQLPRHAPRLLQYLRRLLPPSTIIIVPLLLLCRRRRRGPQQQQRGLQVPNPPFPCLGAPHDALYLCVVVVVVKVEVSKVAFKHTRVRPTPLQGAGRGGSTLI